eukprot:scaffold351237_cov83-Attheya_sp.AAC.1
MAEPSMALRLHDNQSFQDQLGHVVHPLKVQTMAHLKESSCKDMVLTAKCLNMKTFLPVFTLISTQPGALTFYGTAAKNTIAIDVFLATGEIVTATHDNEYADLAWGLLRYYGRGQMGIILEYHMHLRVDPGYTHLYIPSTLLLMKNLTWLLKYDEDIGSIAIINQMKNWTNMESMMETHYDQWYDIDYTVFAPAWMKYPVTFLAQTSVFLADFNEDVIEAHGRIFLVQGWCKKHTLLTSFVHPELEWKLARFFLETPLEASDGDIFVNTTKDWNKVIEKTAGKDYLGGYFINYGDSTLNKKSYYGENLKGLQQIKKKYDEENVFITKQGMWNGKG